MAPRKSTLVIRQPMHGQGFFGDVGKLFSTGHTFAKKNRVVSRGLAAAAPLGAEFAPLIMAGSIGAGLLGYGRRRPAKRRKPAKRKAVVRRPVRRRRRKKA